MNKLIVCKSPAIFCKKLSQSKSAVKFDLSFHISKYAHPMQRLFFLQKRITLLFFKHQFLTSFLFCLFGTLFNVHVFVSIIQKLYLGLYMKSHKFGSYRYNVVHERQLWYNDVCRMKLSSGSISLLLLIALCLIQTCLTHDVGTYVCLSFISCRLLRHLNRPTEMLLRCCSVDWTKPLSNYTAAS